MKPLSAVSAACVAGFMLLALSLPLPAEAQQKPAAKQQKPVAKQEKMYQVKKKTPLTASASGT